MGEPTSAPATSNSSSRSGSFCVDVKVIAGGAPITEEFVQEIGADGYARDASAAVRRAMALMAS